MQNLFIRVLVLLVLTVPGATAHAQSGNKYNYASQQKLLPAEFGAIFMGMDIKSFSQKINISKAEADDSYEWLSLDIPFVKGGITKITVKFTGLTSEQTEAMIKTEKITEKGEFGDIEREVKRIDPAALKALGKLYEISIFYKEGFDLKNYVLTKYGKPDDTYKKGDAYHFFDMQWGKTTSDKLGWLIRYYEETRALMLAARIPGSEWDSSH